MRAPSSARCASSTQPPARAEFGGAACVTLPIQLLWHHLDSGAGGIAELLRAAPAPPLRHRRHPRRAAQGEPAAVTAQYRRHSWEVRYKVAESKRQSDRDSGAFFGGGGGAASSERSSSSGGGEGEAAVVV